MFSEGRSEQWGWLTVSYMIPIIAKREGVSINQLINSAVSEKMSALMTEEYLDRRAKRASHAKFKAALERVADIEPDDLDRLSDREAS